MSAIDRRITQLEAKLGKASLSHDDRERIRREIQSSRVERQIVVANAAAGRDINDPTPPPQEHESESIECDADPAGDFEVENIDGEAMIDVLSECELQMEVDFHENSYQLF